jgi:hypothetical protein
MNIKQAKQRFTELTAIAPTKAHIEAKCQSDRVFAECVNKTLLV